MIDYISIYQNQLIDDAKNQLDLISEKVLETKSSEIYELLSSFSWTEQLEKWVTAFSKNKLDLKACFKLFEINQKRDFASKEQELDRKIATFLSRFDEDLEKQTTNISFRKSDLSEIEKLARIVNGNSLFVDSDPNKPRRKSMLRDDSKKVLENNLNVKSSDTFVNNERRKSLLRDRSSSKLEETKIVLNNTLNVKSGDTFVNNEGRKSLLRDRSSSKLEKTNTMLNNTLNFKSNDVSVNNDRQKSLLKDKSSSKLEESKKLLTTKTLIQNSSDVSLNANHVEENLLDAPNSYQKYSKDNLQILLNFAWSDVNCSQLIIWFPNKRITRF